MRKLQKISVASFAIFTTFNLSVAQIQSDSMEIMEEISLASIRMPVTLKETGMHVTIIGKEDIQHLPVQSVNELLAYVSGVDIRQRGPLGVQADIGIRGSSFDQVLVLVDGVRMSDPQTGHHQMNLPVPLQMIERIEIIRGTAARRYGINALGGVIHIITKKQLESNISWEVFSMAPTGKSLNESLNGGARLFSGGNIGRWQVMGGVEALKGNGYRANTDFEQIRTYAKAELTHTLGTFSLFGGSNNNAFGASYFYAAPRDSNARETVNTQFLNAQMKADLSPTERLVINAATRWNFDHYVFTFKRPELYQNKHQSNTIQFDAAYEKQFHQSRLSIGIESRTERINSTNLGNHHRNLTGVYSEYLVHWLPEFTTTVGAYGLHTELLGFQVYPGVEFQLGLGDNSALWGNMGTGQRLPTYTDWYYKDPANLSNPNLRSERAQNIELGYRYANHQYQFQASVFRKQYTDMIDWVRSIDTLPWSPENIASLRMEGIEGELRISDFMPILPEGSEWVWNHCLLRADNWESSGVLSKNALNYMRYQQNMRFRIPLWQSLNKTSGSAVYASVNWRYVERFNANGYHLVDARLELSRGKSWNAYINLNNMANTQYREIASVPLLPRFIGLGVAGRW